MKKLDHRNIPSNTMLDTAQTPLRFRRARYATLVILATVLRALPLSAQAPVTKAYTVAATDVRLPSIILRENLHYTDPIRFMQDLQGPLSLSSAQRDSVRQYRKELEGRQRALFKQLEAIETLHDSVEPSDRVLALADRLLDLQDEYRQRARASLTRPQRAQADSIELAWLTEQRRRIEAQFSAR